MRPAAASTAAAAMRRAAFGMFGLILSGLSALAGPPYLTDDPEPTDSGHWEIYNFVSADRGPSGLAGETGVDLNYGGAKDLQLTAVVPIGFQNPRGVRADGLYGGPGVLELAAKYKFLHQSDGSPLPDVSLFPRVFVATDGRFGPPHPNLFLPVWAERDIGPWSVFGGGGLQINPGRGQKNLWQGGLAVTRAFGDTLQLGAEVYAAGPSATGGGRFETVNLGLQLRLVPHWSLLSSVGPGVYDGKSGGDLYIALKADY